MKLVCGISLPLILKVQFLFSLLAFLQDFLGSKIAAILVPDILNGYISRTML